MRSWHCPPSTSFSIVLPLSVSALAFPPSLSLSFFLSLSIALLLFTPSHSFVDTLSFLHFSSHASSVCLIFSLSVSLSVSVRSSGNRAWALRWQCRIAKPCDGIRCQSMLFFTSVPFTRIPSRSGLGVRAAPEVLRIAANEAHGCRLDLLQLRLDAARGQPIQNGHDCLHHVRPASFTAQWRARKFGTGGLKINSAAFVHFHGASSFS